jgi:pteridine reductase
MSDDSRGRLAGRTVLITGAGRRIGAHLARAVHREGANVVIHYRSSGAEAAALAGELADRRPGSTATVAGDLASSEVCAEVVATAARAWNRLDLIVNNASSFYPSPLGSIDAAAFDDLIATNLRAPAFVTQAAQPWLAETGGSVVNLADVHGQRPRDGYSIYCSAKAGMIMLTQALAHELAPRVRVNAVAPGSILWPEGHGGDDPALRASVLQATPLGRQGASSEIAEAVLYLATAAFVTGETIRVDGGRGL